MGKVMQTIKTKKVLLPLIGTLITTAIVVAIRSNKSAKVVDMVEELGDY